MADSNENTITLYDQFLKKEWSYTQGAVLLAVVALALYAISGAWGVTGVLAMWGAAFLRLFGVAPETWGVSSKTLDTFVFFNNQTTVTDVFIIVGAAIASLYATNWKIRKFKHWKQAAAALIGGFLMGLGARFAGGCNIGAFFSGLPRFALSGWVYIIAMFAGATFGGKLLKYFMPPTSNKRPVRKRLTPEQRKRNRRIQILVASVLTFIVLVLSLTLAPKYPKGPYFVLLGTALGYVLQRSRFCFTAAFRDPTLTGETKLTRGVIVTLAVSSILYFGFHVSQYGDLAALDPAKYPGSKVSLMFLVGAFCFGIGAVLAGGCASGTFMRIGEGYLQNLLALPAFIFGSMIGTPLAASLGKTAFGAGPKIYLPALFGSYVAALVITLLALLGLYILAMWWEKRKKGA